MRACVCVSVCVCVCNGAMYFNDISPRYLGYRQVKNRKTKRLS